MCLTTHKRKMSNVTENSTLVWTNYNSNFQLMTPPLSGKDSDRSQTVYLKPPTLLTTNDCIVIRLDFHHLHHCLVCCCCYCQGQRPTAMYYLLCWKGIWTLKRAVKIVVDTSHPGHKHFEARHKNVFPSGTVVINNTPDPSGLLTHAHGHYALH